MDINYISSEFFGTKLGHGFEADKTWTLRPKSGQFLTGTKVGQKKLAHGQNFEKTKDEKTKVEPSPGGSISSTSTEFPCLQFICGRSYRCCSGRDHGSIGGNYFPQKISGVSVKG